MTRRPAGLLAALLVCAAALLAPPADARTPAPRGFFGVMADGPIIEPIGLDLAREARVMRRAGVGTVRMVLYWDQIEPVAGGPLQWERYDAFVAALARQRIRVFPVLFRAPEWARTGDPTQAGSPPDPDAFARFAAAAVARYGHRGAFWSALRGLPRMPVTHWQVWNEPNLDDYWLSRPWATTYTALLRTANDAIKGIDPRAKVVTAGLTGDLDELIGELYDAGARDAFDTVAVNVYRHRPDLVYWAIHAARAEMARRGDRAKIIASEVSFSSGLGQSTYNLGIERDEPGQREALVETLDVLAAERRALGLAAVHWYTWLSWPLGREVSFAYSGLRRLTPEGAVVSKPALAGLRRVATGRARLSGR